MQFSKIGSVLLVIVMSFIATAIAGLHQIVEQVGEPSEIRTKRDHHHHPGVTGPVHTFVKTDKHANFKWGVRHHVGKQYAGR